MIDVTLKELREGESRAKGAGGEPILCKRDPLSLVIGIELVLLRGRRTSTFFLHQSQMDRRRKCCFLGVRFALSKMNETECRCALPTSSMGGEGLALGLSFCTLGKCSFRGSTWAPTPWARALLDDCGSFEHPLELKKNEGCVSWMEACDPLSFI